VTSGDLKKAKRDVRRSVLAARDALTPAERDAKAAAIAAHLFAMDDVRAAEVVLAFWSFGSEVPTARLLETLGVGRRLLALPRIVGSDLEARTYEPGDPLEETSFGAMEPADGAPVDPSDLDVILTPAVAFDAQGRRVGYGGGFYDRLFPRAPGAARIGIGYDLQVRTEPLPAGGFDLRVHAIVTESGVLRIAGRT
jgi:5-formyltetrahydrofolate cyclo-ligase